jgi:transcriptional regulator with XRE-family HTH domain
MNIGQKLRYLRTMEGALRGLDRDMTQQSIVDAIWKEQRSRISQSYLSQIESGKRRHLTNETRLILSRFFKVHPGYLVDDPEGFHTELTSDVRTLEDSLDLWLQGGAQRFGSDREMSQAILTVAGHPDSRRCLILLGAILESEGLVERLIEVLGPSERAGRLPISKKGRGGTR